MFQFNHACEVNHTKIGHNRSWPHCPLCELQSRVKPILDKYKLVASGESQGAGGVFYADSKSTLNAITIPIEDIEALAKACNAPVLSRTWEGRQSNICDKCGEAAHVTFCTKPDHISKEDWQRMSDDARLEAEEEWERGAKVEGPHNSNELMKPRDGSHDVGALRPY